MVDKDEEIRVWQSDMSSAFYLFSLPSNWSELLAFNIIRKGTDLGFGDDKEFALACAVLPMGWCNSVSLMQEASENILLLGSLDPLSQLVRGKTSSTLGYRADQQCKEAKQSVLACVFG